MRFMNFGTQKALPFFMGLNEINLQMYSETVC